MGNIWYSKYAKQIYLVILAVLLYTFFVTSFLYLLKTQKPLNDVAVLLIILNLFRDNRGLRFWCVDCGWRIFLFVQGENHYGKSKTDGLSVNKQALLWYWS